jgi:glycosylphosphatidylinositol deacylase
MAAHRLLPLLALLSVLLTCAFVSDIISTKRFESACEMTWSWPVYSPATWRGVPSHPKYQLHRVDMKNARESLDGVPVLFVPGHMGSYKQARSLSRHLWDTDEQLFDLFALDFNEEPTGLSGALVKDQATFLNEAVRAILREYKRQGKKGSKSKKKGQAVLPESVVIVAHSMGGVVARAAEMLPNYKRRSIQHVVALGVPYERPAFPFDAEMNALYEKMHAQKGREDDVVYVSVAGGHKDTLVQTELASVDTVADPSRAFAVLASAIPTVETPVDHFCLLWCHQLLKVVAESLYKAVDLETRELLSSPSRRLAIAKEALLAGGVEAVERDIAANVSLHHLYVQDGYYPGEYAGYALLLPQFLTSLLRTKLATVIVIMYALALQIFYAQVAQWQTRFNLQSTSSPQDLSQENFPSFTSMLHPASHAPAFLKSGVAYVLNANLGLSTATTAATAVVSLGVAAVAGYTGYAQLLSGGQSLDSLAAPATLAAEVAILYAYALGLFYAITKLFSLLQRFVASPVVSLVDNVTDRLKLRRWMIIALIHGVLQLLGQLANPSSAGASTVLGLLVLGAFAVFVVYSLALGGSNDGTSDQQRMKRSLFAVLYLSVFPWVGKLAYFTGVVQWPPSELSNDLLMEGASYVAVLSLFTYCISLSLDGMIPLPPTAFFGTSSGQDAASAYGKSSSHSSVKITAENCPKCIFEDGGPGALLEEYSDRTTRRVVAGKTREVVYVGPTFRVVSCDCVYRFKNSRDFCDFCVRSCRLCGGGSGNYQEAAKYKDFLDESKVDLAMHALVPMAFQICAAVQATYGLSRAHMSFFLTPVCVLALILYHLALRHPIEARRIKNKQRKNITKKKKSSSKSKSKATTDAPAASSTASDATSRNNKKKKRKSGPSSASSASPLIEEASPSS